MSFERHQGVLKIMMENPLFLPYFQLDGSPRKDLFLHIDN